MNPSGWCKVVHPGDAMPLVEEGLGLLITMWADAAAERWWGANRAWVYKRHGTPFLLDVEDRRHLLRLDALVPETTTPHFSVQWMLVDREGGPAMAALCCLCGRSPHAHHHSVGDPAPPRRSDATCTMSLFRAGLHHLALVSKAV